MMAYRSIEEMPLFRYGLIMADLIAIIRLLRRFYGDDE